MAMTVGSLRARVDADIDGALRGIRQVQREMKSLTRVETVVRVRLDVSAARSQIQPLLQQLRSIQRASWNTSVNLNVKTNIAKAQADLRALKADANALKNAIKPVEIRINTKGTQKQLQPLIAQLRSFQKANASISLKATVTEAMQKLNKVLVILREIKTLASTPIKLNIDGGGVKALRDIQRQLSQLTGSGTNWSAHARGIQSVRQSAQQATPALSRMQEILVAFGAGYLGIAGIRAALGALKSVFIDFNNVLAEANVGFTTLFANGGLSLRDAQTKADGFLETLKQFAIPTPFEVVDLAPLAQQSLAFGLVSKASKTANTDLTGLLRDVGDAAYGLGRGKVGVDRIMLAFGQMKVATRVMGQEMFQMQQIGVNAWEYLAKATGKSTREVKDLVEKGLIPADGAIKAIRAGLRRDFGGGMERASKTFAGATAQISDALKVKISDALKPQFEQLTRAAVAFAESLNGKGFDNRMTALANVTQGALDKIGTALRFASDLFTQNEALIVASITAIGLKMLWFGAITRGQPVVALALFAMGLQTASDATGKFGGAARVATPVIYGLAAAIAAVQIATAISGFVKLAAVVKSIAWLKTAAEAVKLLGVLGGIEYLLPAMAGGLALVGIAAVALTGIVGIGAIGWQKYQEKVSLAQMAQADLDFSSKKLAKTLETTMRYAGADPKVVAALETYKKKYDELGGSVAGLARLKNVELPKVAQAIKVSTVFDALDRRVLDARLAEYQKDLDTKALKVKVDLDAAALTNPGAFANFDEAFRQQWGATNDWVEAQGQRAAREWLKMFSDASFTVSFIWKAVWDGIGHDYRAVVNLFPAWIKSPAEKAAETLKNAFTGVFGWLGEKFKGAWNYVKDLLTASGQFTANYGEGDGSTPKTFTVPKASSQSSLAALGIKAPASNKPNVFTAPRATPTDDFLTRLGLPTTGQKTKITQAEKDLATAEARAAARAKVAIPGIDLTAGTGKDKAGDKARKKAASDAKRAQAEATRVLKDQLADSAKAWDNYATATENAADRQIKALKGIQDSLVSVFDGLKQNLIQAGVLSDPLQPLLDKLSAKLNLGGQAGAIASAAQTRMDFARNQSGAARSQQEIAGGLDGVVPSKYSGSSHNANPGASVLNQIADAVNSPMGAAACARFVSFAFKKMGIAVKTTDAAGQLVKNARKAGAREIPISQAGAGDLIYQYGRDKGVLKDAQGNGYHVGFGLGNGRMAAKNRNYLGPVWKNARALDTSALANGNAALQARANATGKAQVAVRSLPSAPEMNERKDFGVGEFIAGLSNLGKVQKGWGGAIQNKPGNEARFAIQSFLTTKEGRDLIAQLAPGFNAKKGNQSDQAAWYLRTQANQADAKTSAALMPERIAEAGRATAEFVKAKRNELGVLRDSSKWLKANAFEALGLAKAQEESKVRAEAENDEKLKGLPIKQREWNITTRIKAAVSALAESYRHNAFAAHIQRIGELDKEYSALGATTLAAQIHQKVFNQENAASLTIDEKRLQVAKELRNERTKTSVQAVAETLQRTREARRTLDTRGDKNDVDKLISGYRATDEEARVKDPGYRVDITERAARSREIYQARRSFAVTSAEDATKRVNELYSDQELTLSKISRLWQNINFEIKSRALDAGAMPGADVLKDLQERAAGIKTQSGLKDLLGRAREFSSSTVGAFQSFTNRDRSPLNATLDQINEFETEIQAVVDGMKARGEDVLQFAGFFKSLSISISNARDAAHGLADGEAAAKLKEYADNLKGIKDGMARDDRLGSFLDPAKRALEEWKYSLRDQRISEADIEGLLPAKRIQMRAEEARGYIQEFLSSTQSTLTSAFDSLYTEGPGKFFTNLLSGLAQTLQQMSSQILSSYVTSWLTNLIGGAVGGGGAAGGSGAVGGGVTASINPSAFGGFRAAGGPVSARVPYVVGEKGQELFVPNSAGHIISNDALMTARDAMQNKKLQREDAKIPSRSSGGGGASTQTINAPVTYNVGTVVANNPREFHEKLRKPNNSPSETAREVALMAARGQGRF